MKKLFLIVFVFGIMWLLSCGSEVTEVAWKNSVDSGGRVKDIVWAEGDTTWSEIVDKGSVSSAKEVNKTEGTVECSVEEGGQFVVADQVKVNGEAGAIRLNEGSSQVLTLEAH